MNMKPITNELEMTVKTVLDIPLRMSFRADKSEMFKMTLNLNYKPFILSDETPFATSGQYVYTFTPGQRVYKFRLVNRGDGVVTRKDQCRKSKGYVCSLLNNPEGREVYKKICSNFKTWRPNSKVVRLGRGPHMSTAKRGTVRMDKATHFDVYVRD